MTSRQRFLATFTDAPVDRIPIAHIGFCSQVASYILKREAYVGGGVQQWREAASLWQGAHAHQEFLERSIRDAYDLTRATGQDLFRAEYWRLPVKPSARIDDYTYRFDGADDTWTVRRYDPVTELFPVVERGGPPEVQIDSLHELERRLRCQIAAEADAPNTAAKDLACSLMQQYGQELVVRLGGGMIAIPYEPAVWLEAVIERPELVATYLQAQVRHDIRLFEGLAAAGVKIIFGGGDLASNTGPFYSPAAFHELVLPRLKQLTDAAHRLGMYYAFASDGNLWTIADDLFGRSGVDAYYEIDRRASMDMPRLRQRFPKLTLIAANISSHTLHRGTPEQVIRETRECLEVARRYGRTSVGLSNYAVPGTPEQNVWAMLETLDEYRDG